MFQAFNNKSLFDKFDEQVTERRGGRQGVEKSMWSKQWQPAVGKMMHSTAPNCQAM